MKVAIVTAGTLPVPAVKGGAVEALVENLAKENEKYSQFELVIISIFDHEAEKVARKKYPYTRFVFIRPGTLAEALDKATYFLANRLLKKRGAASYRNLFRRLYVLHQTTRILAKEKFDKVVLENSATLFRTLKGKHNYKKYEGNYYFHIHNAVTGSYGCADIIKGCKTLAVSDYINRTLPDFMHAIPGQNLRVVPNAVDTERFSKNESVAFSQNKDMRLREKYHIQHDEKVILFTGRLTQEKGVKELLLAFRQAKLPKTKLVIAGAVFFGSGIASEFESELREIAEPMNESIIFTGFVSYDQMPEIYRMADLAVVPSMWNDPAPLTVIEAMASGLPLITTLSGGIPEYAKADCAFLFPRDERIIVNLTWAMRELVMNDERRLMMSRVSRARSKKMNLDRYYATFVKEISS